MRKVKTIALRSFLGAAVTILGGVAFGTYAYKKIHFQSTVKHGKYPDAICADDASGVTLITLRAEMGQGVQSTLAAMVAEEMDLDWDQVRVMHGPSLALISTRRYWRRGAVCPCQ